MNRYNEYVKDPLQAIDPMNTHGGVVKMLTNRKKEFTGIEIHIGYIEIDAQTNDFTNSFKGPFKFQLGQNAQGAIKVEYSGNNAYSAIVNNIELTVDYAIRIAKVLTLIEIKKERIANITPKQEEKIVNSYNKLAKEIASMGRSDRPAVETRSL